MIKTKLTMIQRQAIAAHNKAYETNRKLELIKFFQETHQSKFAVKWLTSSFSISVQSSCMPS